MSELRGFDSWKCREDGLPGDHGYRPEPVKLNCHRCGSHSDGSEIKDTEGRWRATCADCYRELRFGLPVKE